MLEEEKVKCKSKNLFNCKRNKGEHEWLEPTIESDPKVRYIQKHRFGELDSNKLLPDCKFIKAEIHLATETKCRHCGKKVITFFNQKLC